MCSLPLVDGYRYGIEEVLGEELGSPYHEEHQPDSESSRPEHGRHARSQVSLDVGGDDSQRHDPEHDGDPGDETGGFLLELGGIPSRRRPSSWPGRRSAREWGCQSSAITTGPLPAAFGFRSRMSRPRRRVPA